MWTQDGCIDGNLMEVWTLERRVGAGSGVLPQLMASAAEWVKKVDRRSTIGGFGAIEPGDQEQLELLAYQTGAQEDLSSEGKPQAPSGLCLGRPPAAPVPNRQGAGAAQTC